MRLKSKLKKIGYRLLPLLCGAALLFGEIYSCVETTKADALTETLYYTFYDLMAFITANSGYDMTVEQEYYDGKPTPDAKSVWDHFVYDITVDANTKLDALNWTKSELDKAIDELVDLPNSVTEDGVSISDSLQKLLDSVMPDIASNGFSGSVDTSSVSSVRSAIAGAFGCDVSEIPNSDVVTNVVKYGFLLSVYSDSEGLYAISIDPRMYKIVDFADSVEWNGKTESPLKVRDVITGQVKNFGDIDCISRIDSNISSGRVVARAWNSWTWIIKNGEYAEVVGSNLNSMVKLKEREDVQLNPPRTKFKSWEDYLRYRDALRKKALEKGYPEDALTKLYDEYLERLKEEETAEKDGNKNDNDDEDKKKKKKRNDKDKLPIPIPIIFPSDIIDPDPDPDPDPEEDEDEKNKDKTDEDEKNKHDSKEDGEGGIPEDERHEDPEDVIDASGKAGDWKKLFPFCIPWDMMSLIKTMNTAKQAPKFHFEFYFKTIKYKWVIDVDMSDYWKYIKIFRWGMTILFIIGLFYVTVKFTTFVQRMGG